MQDMLIEIIYLVEEKRIGDCIEKVYRMFKVAKEIHDCQLHYLMYKLLGIFMLHLNKWMQAKLLFECIRDVSSEC